MCTKEINIFCLPKCVRKRSTSSVSQNVYERDVKPKTVSLCTRNFIGKVWISYVIFFQMLNVKRMQTLKHLINEVWIANLYIKQLNCDFDMFSKKAFNHLRILGTTFGMPNIIAIFWSITEKNIQKLCISWKYRCSAII